MKKIKDEEVEKLLDTLIQVLPSRLSYVFGTKINVKLTTTAEEKKKYVELVKKYIQSINQIQVQIKQMEMEKVNHQKILGVYLAKMDTLQHLINPKMPVKQHFVHFYLDFFTNLLNEPSESSFIESTRYKRYKNLLKELMLNIITLKRGDKLKRFLEQIEKSGDPIVFTQAFFIRLKNDYQFLDKKRVRITKRTIVRYIKIYGEFAGHFEKLIVGVLGLIEILRKNKIPDYSELRNSSIAKKYWKIRKDPEYSEMAKPFNKIIRNSIAHSNYTFLPIEKKIKFMDLKEKIEVTYEEFDNQVKELSSLVLALSQLKLIFLVITYHMLKDVLEHNEELN